MKVVIMKQNHKSNYKWSKEHAKWMIGNFKAKGLEKEFRDYVNTVHKVKQQLPSIKSISDRIIINANVHALQEFKKECNAKGFTIYGRKIRE